VRVGIAVCRYALDGHVTQLEHRDPAPAAAAAGTVPPAPWITGAETDLPIEPQITPVQPSDATDDVAATYEYLAAELETPNRNNIYRAYGTDPAFLSTVVEAQIPVAEAETDLSRTPQGLYAAALLPTRTKATSRRARTRRRTARASRRRSAGTTRTCRRCSSRYTSERGS
jgi:hypothetical protein